MSTMACPSQLTTPFKELPQEESSSLSGKESAAGPLLSLAVQESLVCGVAHGPLVACDAGLSFWGGVDPLTSIVLDHTHPLRGVCIAGCVLAIPNGRGSCTGSQVVLELLLNGRAPAAIILKRPDVIVALGVIVADELFGKSIPVLSVGEEGFQALLVAADTSGSAGRVVEAGDGEQRARDDDHSPEGSPVFAVVGSQLRIFASHQASAAITNQTCTEQKNSRSSSSAAPPNLHLTPDELSLLERKSGTAASQIAMRIVARAAAVQGATHLLPIHQAHIDACCYIGPGGLKFAQRLVELHGKFAVPTTLNAISVDSRERAAPHRNPTDFHRPFRETCHAHARLSTCGHAHARSPCCIHGPAKYVV